MARSQEPAAAQNAHTTSSPVEAKKRSYENEGGLSARSTRKVATPKSTDATRFSSGR